MDKPSVAFSEILTCEVGYPAFCKPLDHPSSLVSNTKYVRTSPVVSKIVDGLDRVVEFETLNTKYIRIGHYPNSVFHEYEADKISETGS